jgi:nucleoid-associated protein YgaU
MTPPAPATRPAAPVASAPPTTGRTYTIKPGDSLWKISKEVYGDATKYEQIQKANPTIDPQLLKPGTVIVIP